MTSKPTHIEQDNIKSTGRQPLRGGTIQPIIAARYDDTRLTTGLFQGPVTVYR